MTREQQQLVTSNLKLAAFCADRFWLRLHGADKEDLYQEACTGLCAAAIAFNPRLGVPFGAYARMVIFRKLIPFVVEHMFVVRQTRACRDQGFLMKNASSHAARSAVDVDVDLLSASTNVEATVARAEHSSRVRDALANESLTERDRDILRLRVMADDPETLIEVGARWGVTRERVRQVEAALLTRLRPALEGLRE